MAGRTDVKISVIVPVYNVEKTSPLHREPPDTDVFEF